MHSERADEPKFELPKDLVAEMSRRSAPKQEQFYHVEAMKPSFFGRMAETFFGRKK